MGSTRLLPQTEQLCDRMGIWAVTHEGRVGDDHVGLQERQALCAGGHLCPPTSTPSAILTAVRTLGQQPLCSPTALPGAPPGLPTAKERGEQLLLCLAGVEPRDRELPGPFSELQVSGRLAPGGISAPSICQVHLSVSQVCNYGRVVIAVVRTTQNAIL